MARKGRVDRGLIKKMDTAGKAVWSVRLWHEGKERRFGAFPSKTKIREFYEKTKLEQKEGRFFPERYQRGGNELVQDLLDQYELTLPHSGKKASTIWDERFYAKWWGPRLAGKRLNQVKPTDLEAVKRELTEKGYAPQTVVHYLKFLRHVLNVAIRDGKLERNPFAQVNMPKLSHGKTRFLSPEEEAILMRELGPVYGPWARLAILTGMRKTELFSLRWSELDLERGLATLPQTKTSGVQYAHLNKEAIEILRGMDSWKRSVWVFPSKNPARHLDSYNFYGRVYLPAVKRAKLEEVTWHTCRHTFASRLAMNGQGASTIAALLRHSSLDLVQRYAHLSPTHLKAAVEGVATFGKGQPRGSEDTGNGKKKGQVSAPTVTKTGMETGEKVGESA